MKELYCTDRAGISQEKVVSMCEELLAQYPDVKKALIVPRITPAATATPVRSPRSSIPA